MESCARLYEELKQVVPEVQLMTEQNKTYMKGVLVMPGYMAKGFEFTTVVLADADATNYSEKADETLLYTIASRATRKLFLIKGKSTQLPEAITKMNAQLFHAIYQ